ncbi:iron ABC transporter [Muribaculum sp. An289]|uniref:Iron ABC transporter permease n=1 Tax=Candidatus Merdivivens faecigallinarum TaxID=2840871 RepID=A0A9D9NQB0_9BACT|nr:MULTISPECIES: iron ABC transporter permease [unclassified Muribaculum]MBO8481892.1 iron ABC transporter permease [Candidatus Merdivivens faecigallinarum]OUO36937.1 iron ABC transporter [Muribaculum sp. An289]OUO42880.1 iron ABC transporter [Muribaculum sp. An287]
MSARVKILFVVFSLLTLALFIADLMFGSVKVSPAEIAAVLTGGGDGSVNERIIIDIRLVKAIVAVIAGAALSVSGLQMQTLFQNPLAGPSVLGVTSGASLGAALLIIGLPVAGGMSPVLSSFGVAGAAWLGAAAVMAVIVAVSRRIKDIMVILILGMMFSSGVSAIVQVLQYVSNESALKSFVIWTMGALGDVTYTQLALLAPVFLAGMVLAVAAVKPLNLLLLGEKYARTMGLNVKRSRTMVFLSTTLLAGSVTAFCGPIGFIGLAVPHVARYVFSSSDHRILVPATTLVGAAAMLVCDLISKTMNFPVNTITSLLGIPIVVWVVVRNKNIFR